MWGGDATGESAVLPAPVLVQDMWYFESEVPSFPSGPASGAPACRLLAYHSLHPAFMASKR